MSLDLLNPLSKRIPECEGRRQREFKRRMQALRKRAREGKPIDRGLGQLESQISASVEARETRLAGVPKPEYDDNLPISARREEIAEAIRQHQVVVVAGETGSGKTTQIPKICLDVGRGVDGLIGCTQPRRIAARSVAQRVSQELKTEPGTAVGWKVRFNDHTGPNTYIKFMTDGILLAEAHGAGGAKQGGDRFLNQYDTLIIDEAHERSLNIDFLLGYLKQLLPRRPDLKVIITSATIDTERFSKHFNNAPVIEVSGRTYPVELRYRPLQGEDEDDKDRDMQQAILDAVDELSHEGGISGKLGDVLIFLPGEREIRETAENLRKHHPPHTEILPLYARLTPAEQNKVFQSHSGRRIVLATNVAETSLTVPGIRYVIDPGVARISRYNPTSQVQRLPVEKVSQASANQRKGRCGRVAAGVCIRLYSGEDFNSRVEFTDPEIRRTSLADVILRMQSLKLGTVEAFPFIDPPERRQVRAGYKLLEEIGAVDANHQLTQVGRDLSRLPVDPKVGRMILAGAKNGVLREVLIIASALSVPDPRQRPADKRQAADQKHAQWKHEESEFLSFVKLWDGWQEQSKPLSNTQFRKWCQKNWLGYLRLREWRDIHSQLYTVVREHGMELNDPIPVDEANYTAIHTALLSGLLGNIGLKDDKDVYVGARNLRFAIFPGSPVRKKRPRWLMCAQLLETSKLYALTVARIEPEWIEPLSKHLIKRSYQDPHWEKRPAQVAAYERVTLYGLPIIAKRRINFGPIDPVQSRELFIRDALVNGEYHTRAKFFHHNRDLVEEIKEMEAKQRRRDLLEEEVLETFYEEKVPEGIYSGKSFDTWRKKVEREEPRHLFLSREDLLQRDTAHLGKSAFPDHIDWKGLHLSVEYHFDPGKSVDGINLVVPLSALNLMKPARFEWLVPGLLRDRLVELLRSLPKGTRKNFVPVPDFADALMEALDMNMANRGEDLFEVIERQLLRMTGTAVPRGEWKPNSLSDHLRMNYKVVDEDGKVLDMDRDLTALQGRLGGRAKDSFANLPKIGVEHSNMTDWEAGDLEDQVDLEQGGVMLHGYPALVDQGDAVQVQVMDRKQDAEHAHALGLRRLFMLQSAKKIKYLRRNNGLTQQAALHYTAVGTSKELEEDLLNAVFDQAFRIAQDPVHKEADFHQRLEEGTAALAGVAQELGKKVSDLLLAHHQLRKTLTGKLPPQSLKTADLVRQHLDRLVYKGFIADTPVYWLSRLPVYLKAMISRLDKSKSDPDKDHQLQALVQPFLKAMEEDQRLRQSELRWMLEEFHVSLFAQGLRTVKPVSAKRLEKLQQQLQDTD